MEVWAIKKKIYNCNISNLTYIFSYIQNNLKYKSLIWPILLTSIAGILVKSERIIIGKNPKLFLIHILKSLFYLYLDPICPAGRMRRFRINSWTVSWDEDDSSQTRTTSSWKRKERRARPRSGRVTWSTTPAVSRLKDQGIEKGI